MASSNLNPSLQRVTKNYFHLPNLSQFWPSTFAENSAEWRNEVSTEDLNAAYQEISKEGLKLHTKHRYLAATVPDQQFVATSLAHPELVFHTRVHKPITLSLITGAPNDHSLH